MKTSEEILNILKDKFGDSIIELKSDKPIDSFVLAAPLEVDKICMFLRDNSDLQFDSLMNLSGVDDANGEKVKDNKGTETINGGTLSVWYHLESTKLKHKFTLKVSTERAKPEVTSVTEIWKCADWHEREAYDMYGIIFLNHPDLRRILMPYDWEHGYPLRKDYRNPEFYQGMKVPY
ncbi:MAG: NADH-quinone oxidoreductase subunit C [Ignavibacteria bacterium]|nr:NADH-quinone oxidoreductase subunit C [Ignavibacteria bacterium]MBT8393177.1 NADH-quinone oxidoreductase subunit C [Ignavibacteria bacterium]NNJ53786.1 NADH-quinone oxidoreductase subunit C [Ignavibacteriaceae bacterium]NNL21267.1 NADH-quinone oxidoreductase subunit C [Ignavibacteriaceae bacterium]